jgi:DNA-binding MarR family transcriptional regulator
MDIVHTMNYQNDIGGGRSVTDPQVRRFQELVNKLFQCCQERMQFQSEKFQLPDAELRCLLLFGEERYLTPKGISLKMNVVKSRVSKIITGLVKKRLIQRIKDPEDSRVTLLSLTSKGTKKLYEINEFMAGVHENVLLQMTTDQRQMILTNLEILKASMESVKDMMV